VPAIAEAQVLSGFDAEGKPTFRPPKCAITLRHLLTHGAGFSYEIWNPDIQKVQAALGIPGVTECKNKALSCCSTRANAGSTASTSTGPARWSRRSAARSSAPTGRRTCSGRWA
jgi:hypothetical protein